MPHFPGRWGLCSIDTACGEGIEHLIQFYQPWCSLDICFTAKNSSIMCLSWGQLHAPKATCSSVTGLHSHCVSAAERLCLAPSLVSLSPLTHALFWPSTLADVCRVPGSTGHTLVAAGNSEEHLWGGSERGCASRGALSLEAFVSDVLPSPPQDARKKAFTSALIKAPIVAEVFLEACCHPLRDSLAKEGSRVQRLHHLPSPACGAGLGVVRASTSDSKEQSWGLGKA